jgi:pimeloyl-ACP methyl ester carboxylesterase
MIKTKHPMVAALLAAALIPNLSVAQSRFEAEPSDHAIHSDTGTTSDSVPGEKIVDLSLAGGERQRVLYASPMRPTATIVMLPGGAGDVGLRRNGDVLHDDNFVVRTRALWVQRGYAVLIPDTVDRANLRGLRSSPEYGAVVEELVDFAHNQLPGPVFLLGTSQGSIAAMNGAAHARPGAIAGVVLTESVSRMGASGETVFSADPRDVHARALVVANQDDRCDVAPPQDAPRIAAAMTHSASVRILSVAGGIRRSRSPCGSLTPHGYYGIESSVIGRIDSWMRRV